MKKLFVSVPMKGRTEENIKNSMEVMKIIAEGYFGERLKIIDTWIADIPDGVKDSRIYCLGKSIQLLSDADYFIGVQPDLDFGDFPGCFVESQVAREYNIPMISVDMKQCNCFFDIDPNYECNDCGCNYFDDCDDCYFGGKDEEGDIYCDRY